MSRQFTTEADPQIKKRAGLRQVLLNGKRACLPTIRPCLYFFL